MQYPETFAMHFARAIELFGIPEAKEDQKHEFRALVALGKTGAVTLVNGEAHLVVNGSVVKFPAIQGAVKRLQELQVREIQIDQAGQPEHLFHLFKVLSRAVDRDVQGYLDEMKCTTVRVVLRNERAEGVEAAIGGKSAETSVSSPRVSAPDPSPLVAETVPAVAEAIRELQADPVGDRVPELLRMLMLEVEQAARDGWMDQALAAAQAVIRAETRVQEEQARRQYAVALKSILGKPLLEKYAHQTTEPRLKSAATEVLRRAGEKGTAVLLELLAASPLMKERMSYFDALTRMSEGSDMVIDMLHHEQWYVVRNIAELCGELKLTEAIPKLGELIDEPDDRVRKAAGGALAKIGTSAGTEFLRRALHDPSPAVRQQVVAGMGQGSSAMAMPIVAALEEEDDPGVRATMLHALGRIGTPDAVQLLIKMSERKGRIFKRRPTSERVAAIEGLRDAGSPAAITAIEALLEDSDREVRQAAHDARRQLHS